MKFINILIKCIVALVILFIWTNARHEGSHALMASLEGASVPECKLFPGIHPNGSYYFGYVLISGGTSWLTIAGPFFSDLILLLITLTILIWKRNIKFYKIIFLLGFISPLIDLLYNYQGGFWRTISDVYRLNELLPKAIVHFYFISLIIGTISLMFFFRKRRVESV